VEIARLVASLRGEGGQILIPGFYDDVRAPTAAEKAALAVMPPVESQLEHDLGITPITAERLDDSYFHPTLNIRSIHAGDTGPDAANAIATSAYASFDFRLVPDETPERTKQKVEAFLADRGWFVTRTPPDLATRLAHPKIVMVQWGEGSSMPVRIDMSGPAARAAVAAIERAEGAPILQLPMVGASSGIAVMVSDLDAPMVGVSIANYDDNQHAENENIRLGNLWDGIDVYAALLADLSW
jgi:acetylornithine deacetylase/succinyl-diaminopimelate desuccinylase-like protein